MELQSLSVVGDAFVGLLADGLLGASWWQVLLFTAVVTHVTIASVTIFLHRAQAHRSVELHAMPSHFFRFWLWLTTGMVTKEWVAIHRKHHAKCETEEDPHSPQTRGIGKVVYEGAELYRAEAKNAETMEKYGSNTPDDWIERHLYTRFSWQGVGVMLVVNVVLFGAIGAAVWAAQMAWIPFWAAGIVNGVGHWWGYRNFEAPDASKNISPWGIVIGGEELHNNHHTYPTAAKFSVKRYEFDMGWVYIRGLEMMGLAKVRRVPPQLKLGEVRAVADSKTLEGLIANRYEVMAGYAAGLQRACKAELARVSASSDANSLLRAADLRVAGRWLHRDEEQIPHRLKARVAAVRAEHPVLEKLVFMREELRSLWTRTNVSAEQLVAELQAWCKRAEESGIASLQEFAMKLRAVRV